MSDKLNKAHNKFNKKKIDLNTRDIILEKILYELKGDKSKITMDFNEKFEKGTLDWDNFRKNYSD